MSSVDSDHDHFLLALLGNDVSNAYGMIAITVHRDEWGGDVGVAIEMSGAEAM